MTTPWEPDGHADAFDPGAEAAAQAERRRADRWRVFGIVLVVLTAIVGLLLVAGALFVVTAINSYGSNK